MKVWYHSILSALGYSTLNSNLPIKTIFDGLYLDEHQLLIHFISIDAQKLHQLPTNYFANISLQAEHIGIRCVHVWEDVYKQHAPLVEARVLAMTGQRQRIHARSTKVIRIDKHTAGPFLQQHHLQGDVSAYYKYGLFKDDSLVAVATFSKSRVMQDGVVPYRSCELIRFASLTGYTVTGGLSKLLNRFMIDVKPAHLMTYADRDWGDGAGYRKLGFLAVGKSEPLVCYLHPQSMERYFPKQQDTIPEGCIAIYTSGSIKYVLDKRDYTS